MSIEGFYDAGNLPKTLLPGGVKPDLRGHHAIPQAVFNKSPFLQKLASEKLFDGRDWRANGVPLPGTADAADKLGGALHRGKK